MLGDVQKIHCCKCNKYLFTEMDTKNGYKRENDNEDYFYDEESDEFSCSNCYKIKIKGDLGLKEFNSSMKELLEKLEKTK